MTVIRKTGATWVIPNEDEWYKAAYYDPNKDGTGVAGYWDFPTKSDGWTRPNNDVTEPDGRNSANFRTSENFDDDYTLGAPYFTTLIGEFENSGSAYGTFDQGGNVAEWNETEIDVGLSRGLRGGSWGGTVDGLLASNRILLAVPSTASTGLGFRVANVPEPAGVTLLLGIAAVMLWRWQRNRISP